MQAQLFVLLSALAMASAFNCNVCQNGLKKLEICTPDNMAEVACEVAADKGCFIATNAADEEFRGCQTQFADKEMETAFPLLSASLTVATGTDDFLVACPIMGTEEACFCTGENCNEGDTCKTTTCPAPTTAEDICDVSGKTQECVPTGNGCDVTGDESTQKCVVSGNECDVTGDDATQKCVVTANECDVSGATPTQECVLIGTAACDDGSSCTEEGNVCDVTGLFSTEKCVVKANECNVSGATATEECVLIGTAACDDGSICTVSDDICNVTAETQECVTAGATTCDAGSACTVEANICDTADEANFCVTPQELADGGAASVAAMSAGIALALVAAISV